MNTQSWLASARCQVAAVSLGAALNCVVIVSRNGSQVPLLCVFQDECLHGLTTQSACFFLVHPVAPRRCHQVWRGWQVLRKEGTRYRKTLRKARFRTWEEALKRQGRQICSGFGIGPCGPLQVLGLQSQCSGKPVRAFISIYLFIWERAREREGQRERES